MCFIITNIILNIIKRSKKKIKNKMLTIKYNITIFVIIIKNMFIPHSSSYIIKKWIILYLLFIFPYFYLKNFKYSIFFVLNNNKYVITHLKMIRNLDSVIKFFNCVYHIYEYYKQ